MVKIKETTVEENITAEAPAEIPSEVEDEQEEEVVSEPKITDIKGIGPATLKKLSDAGIYELMGIAVMAPKNLAELAGLGVPSARKVIQEANKILKIGFEKGSDFQTKMRNVSHITTGVKSLDKLIGGGIESKSITEVFGAWGAGKSQLAHAIAVNVQMPIDKGGLEGKAVFIDTEGTFRGERVKEFAVGAGLDPEEALDNVLVARAFSSDHQILLLDKIHEMINDGENIRLIIIDSLMAHFRAEYIGRGLLSERQGMLGMYMHKLSKIAEQYNVAIYLTNQVMSNPGQMFGDPITAIGGNIVHHSSNVRLYIRRAAKDTRVIKMIDHPCLPDGETVFKVETDKLVDLS